MAEITFDCPSCRQSLETDAADAGSHIQCPSCKAYIVVPEQPLPKEDDQGDDNELRVKPQSQNHTAGTKRCPGCGSVTTQGAIICVSCGLNLVSGRKMTTAVSGSLPIRKVSLPVIVLVVAGIVGCLAWWMRDRTAPVNVAGGVAPPITTGTTTKAETVEDVLRRIIIPDFEFRQANFHDVVAFLNQAFKDGCGSGGKVVNIVWVPPVGTSTPVPEITMSGRYMPLDQIITLSADAAGCSYGIDSNTVTFRPGVAAVTSSSRGTETNSVAMRGFLSSVIIPDVEFRQANIYDIVEFLGVSCRNASPTGRVVNIVFIPRQEGKQDVTPVPEITMTARYIVLTKVLDIIAQTAGLTWSVDGNTVIIRPAKQKMADAPPMDAKTTYEAALTFATGKGAAHSDRKAFELMISAAEQGYLMAQHDLAVMYNTGQGCKRDVQKAMEWFTKAAGQGEVTSQLALGWILVFGQGVKKDPQAGFGWYQKAYDQGSMDAAFAMGALYEDGLGVGKDVRMAAKLYLEAAEKGNVEAQKAVGRMYYENGDENKAIYWYRKAAAQGDDFAKLAVKAYESDHAKPVSTTCRSCSGKGEVQTTCTKCKGRGKILLTTTKTGFKTCSSCGGFCRSKPGSDQWSCQSCGRTWTPKEERWVKCEACTGGGRVSTDCKTCSGKGKIDTLGKARQDFIRLLTQASTSRSSALSASSGLHPDASSAGSRQSSLPSANKRAATANATPPSADKIQRWRKAAEQGDADSQVLLAFAYRKGEGVSMNNMEAAKWFLKAAEQGDADAQVLLAFAYEEGEGVSMNNVEAAKWFRKSAEQGDATAQGKLGIAYAEGKGIEKNLAEAVKWFRKAAEQGDAVAQCNLGFSYDKGEGVATNSVEATKWFRKAAEQESAAAQYNLGVAYTSGQGVETNFVEAVKWFSKAAENGIPQAQFNLGIAYANGIGVVENAQAAYGWFLIAASGEYDPAKSMVASLEQSLSLAEQETARSWAKQWQLKKTDTREQDDDSTQLTGRRQPKSATQQGEPRFKDERHPQQESYRIGLNHDGSPAVTTTPRWQAQGTAAKDGVRVFDEHQYFAAHYGRFGGAFETAREASDKAKALNVQQTVNLDVMKEAAYNSGPGLSRGNIRLGHWTYEYNATVDSFVVYQE